MVDPSRKARAVDEARNIVIWGATGHARVVSEALLHEGFGVIALFDNDPTVESPLVGVPIFHGEAGLSRWLGAHAGSLPSAVVAIGGHRGVDRHSIQRTLAARGLLPAPVIHRTAFVAGSVRMGAGAQVLARSAVAVDVVMGEACIVNTSASVDHECRLGDGVHICPGVTLAGCVVVEDYATVGAGAVILPRLRIGAGAHVGAGAVVTRDVPAGAVVIGNPARPMIRPGGS